MNESAQTAVAKKPNKLGTRNWILIWTLGMAGQLCWCVENTWFANYLYVDFGYYVEIVTLMTIFSALATTFATFLFGTLSDRIGKRKPFIVWGYVIWGVFTIIYGLTHLYRTKILNDIAIVGTVVVLTDTIMSFFGSAGNDSGFNAWCSDMLNEDNQGQIGMALAVQPVLGTLIGTVVGGAIVAMPAFTNNGADAGAGYMAFFTIMGIFVMLFGLLAQFTMKDVPKLQPHVNGSFWHQFASVFNFKEFIKRKELVWVNVAVTVFFIGFNCYFIHIMNWLGLTLGFGSGNGGLLLGVPLIISVLFAIPLIFLINRNKSPQVALAAIIISIIGCLIIFFFVGDGKTLDNTQLISGKNWALYLGILCVGIGYVASIQTYMVWMKSLYPDDQRGQFEGIRILFFVLFPMVAGPLVANPIIKATGECTNIEIVEGVIAEGQYLPTKWIFLAAAIITLFAVIPLFFAAKYFRERHKAKANA